MCIEICVRYYRECIEVGARPGAAGVGALNFGNMTCMLRFVPFVDLPIPPASMCISPQDADPSP